MAERLIAAVLKTADCNRSGGSNPSFSAKGGSQKKIKACKTEVLRAFLFVLNGRLSLEIGLIGYPFSWIGKYLLYKLVLNHGFRGFR